MDSTNYTEINEEHSSSRRANILSRIALFLLSIPIITLYLVALTGCITHILQSPNFYTVEISNSTSSTSTTFRIGYLGICALNDKTWGCASATSPHAEDLSQRILGTGLNAFDSTNLSLIQFGINLQRQILIPTLLLGFIFFIFGTFGLPFLHSKTKRFGGEVRLRWVSISLLWISTGLAGVSASAITMASGAMSFATRGGKGLRVKSGIPLQVVQWLVWGFSAVFCFGVMSLRRERRGRSASPAMPLLDGSYYR